MRVFLSNLGCKLNQAEVDAMARDFVATGHAIVGSLDEADLHVVNSCTVTHAAARDSRKTARRGNRLATRVPTVVTGCWATESEVEAAGIRGIDLVVPNDRKDDLIELVAERFPDLMPRGLERRLPVSYVPLAEGPTRGLVKIEDGCSMSCSFCIIPTTRGRQRSRPVAEIVAEVAGLAEGGYREVVVTGVQISAYRDDRSRLGELVEAILADTGIDRLRLTSIAPWDLDDRLIELFSRPRICRHAHLSLQSGCDETLQRMRRPYSAEGYAERVQRLRSAVPGIAVTTDVIVGFPGEDEGEFEASRAFVERLGFARVHAFQYSQRPGTEAAAMAGQVPPEQRRKRIRRLIETAESSSTTFIASQLGTVAEVLWEESRDGEWLGTTDNYLRVHSTSTQALHGSLTAARLVGIRGNDVLAETMLPPHQQAWQSRVPESAVQGLPNP